jgi:uncharacterized protein YqgC (DUF456 family)
MEWIPDFLTSASFWAMGMLWLFFIGGFILTILPVAPGNFIVLAGIVLHRIWVPDHSVSWTYILIMLAISLLAMGGDYLLTYWGAKRFGATWRGGLGAIIGALVGFFVPPPLFWLIFGPLIGAVVFELIGGQQWNEAGKAGLGSFLGGIAAMLFKVIVSAVMIAGFFMYS